MREASFKFLESFLKRHDSGLERVQKTYGGKLQGGRVCIVCRLVEVDVFYRGNAGIASVLFSENLEGTVGKHLVDVHVRARPGSTLQEVHYHVPGQGAFGHFAAGK